MNIYMTGSLLYSRNWQNTECLLLLFPSLQRIQSSQFFLCMAFGSDLGFPSWRLSEDTVQANAVGKNPKHNHIWRWTHSKDNYPFIFNNFAGYRISRLLTVFSYLKDKFQLLSTLAFSVKIRQLSVCFFF